jgi:hypothetical protein
VGPRLLPALAALALAGCASLGPQRVAIDRSDYTQRLRESEKAQLLSNVVAMRYGDAPLFLGVTSVISQYTRETSANLHVPFSPPSDDEAGNVGGSLLLRETPTITYTPLSGERFARNLLSPISPVALLAMMEAGWTSDVLFKITVRSVNGVANASYAPLFAQDSDPRFLEAAAALRRLQRTGAVSLRMREQNKVYSAVGRVAPDLSAAQRADLELLRRDLSLGQGGQEMRVVFSSQTGAPGELAISTRSMFEILQEMSQCVDVAGDGRFPDQALLRIHSADRAPPAAHVSVRYRGRWFWIDDTDAESKQMFLLTQVLMSLSDESGSASAPLVTIPAG